MNNNSINAISPIDGRYYNQTHFLDEFFSEKALIKYRLTVEVEYFIKLTVFSYYHNVNSVRLSLDLKDVKFVL